MIKFLVLIVEAIFFLVIGLLYYYAPESSYFWNDGLGSEVFYRYENLSGLLMIVIPFNILISWHGLIKEINNLLMNLIYTEFIGIIVMIPSLFTGDEDASFFLSIALVSAILSFLLLKAFKRILNPKIRILFLISFTIASFIPILFLIFSMLVGGGAA